MALVKTQFELNIGMDNNPLDHDGIVRHFNLNPELGVYFFAQGESEYQGKNENTMHLVGHNTLRLSYLIQRIEELCVHMHQECIAMKYNGQGIMVYNPNYSGDLIAFNPRYWIDKQPETFI